MLQDPVRTLVLHPEHEDVYSKDLLAAGVGSDVELKIAVDLVLENLSPDGFTVLEV